MSEDTESALGDSPPPRRLSGFADPAYWDAVMPDGRTRREHQKDIYRERFEAGLVGGDQRSPKKTGRKTAHEIVAEHAATKADTIIRKLDGMLNHARPEVQAMAIDRYMQIEAKVEKDRRDDEKAVMALSGKELDRELMKEMATALGGIPAINGTAEELPDAEELEAGDYDAAEETGEAA